MTQLPAAAVLLVMLTGCGPQLTAERRYTGQLTGCGAALTATLTRLRGVFVFAPGDGALLLRGTVAADGSIAGSLNTQPPGKPAFVLEVTGRLDEAAATLAYRTPRCTATGTLVLRPATLLP